MTSPERVIPEENAAEGTNAYLSSSGWIDEVVPELVPAEGP